MPNLYVVATPIGNLEDMTLRAIRILKEVKLIAAEDTRKTRQLLAAYDIKTPTTSYHEHNKLTKLDYILDKLATDDVALVSDAGMPGISDPGYELIGALAARGVRIVPIPGPSALISALVISGLPSDSFVYLGFPPHRSSERKRHFTSVAAERRTLLWFESPHRVNASLADMLEIFGDRKVAVARELTKIHEEVFRGTLSQAIGHFVSPRGEFTLVVAGNITALPASEFDADALLKRLRASGLGAREAIQEAAGATGLSRKDLYRIWLRRKGLN